MVRGFLPTRRRQHHGIHAPIAGLRLDLENNVIDDRATPNCNNVTFENGSVRKAKGTEFFARTGTAPFNSPVMAFHVFERCDVVPKFMAFTTTNVYEFNSSLGNFQVITQNVVIDDGESIWTNVTSNVVTSLVEQSWQGSTAVQVLIKAAFTTGEAAFRSIGPIDITSLATGGAKVFLLFRAKLSGSVLSPVPAGTLKITLDESAGGGSPEEVISIPEFKEGDDWKEISVQLSDPTILNAIVRIGLRVDTDVASDITIRLDDFRAVKEFTGDEDDPFMALTVLDFNANNIVVFTNGVDPVQKWDGNSATVVDLTTAPFQARWLAEYGRRLIIFRDVGGQKCRRLAWSVERAPEDFTGVGSDQVDLTGAMRPGDEIQRAEKLGQNLIIYGDHSIGVQIERSSVDNPFVFQSRVNEVGLAAPKALVNLFGHEHIFMGHEDIYAYRGGAGITRLGLPIRDELFNDINIQFINRSFMVHHEPERLIRLYVPVEGSDTPNRYYELDLRERVWSRGTRSFLSGERFQNITGVTWAEIQITGEKWADMSEIRWADLIATASRPIPYYGTQDGRVHRFSDTLFDLGGVSYNGQFDTKDFVLGAEHTRGSTDWFELNFEARGFLTSTISTPTLKVSFSTDQGDTFQQEQTFLVGPKFLNFRFHFQVNSTRIRFRFQSNVGGWAMKWFELGYIPASDQFVA